MSRIGKQPIPIPKGVTAQWTAPRLHCKGPQGELEVEIKPPSGITINEGQLLVTRPDDSGPNRSLHGLTRSLISNMVTGVTSGFERKLEIQGVGYRVAKKGADLEIQVGYSHPVVFAPPENIDFDVPSPTQIVVKGIDKQRVGQVAAEIRAIRKPEPYKGKGIRYEGEVVRRKVGKRA